MTEESDIEALLDSIGEHELFPSIKVIAWGTLKHLGRVYLHILRKAIKG